MIFDPTSRCSTGLNFIPRHFVEMIPGKKIAFLSEPIPGMKDGKLQSSIRDKFASCCVCGDELVYFRSLIAWQYADRSFHTVSTARA
jgi:hypothetical protein